MKNTNSIKKGSVALPQVRFKTGEMVMMHNTDDGMSFDIIKNGKTTPLFDPCADCVFGQTAEFDIDGDGNVSYEDFLRGLRDELTPRRKAMVMKAFAMLDKDNSGKI